MCTDCKQHWSISVGMFLFQVGFVLSLVGCYLSYMQNREETAKRDCIKSGGQVVEVATHDGPSWQCNKLPEKDSEQLRK